GFQHSHALRVAARAAFLVACVAALGGCSGSKGNSASVSGKVTYKDAPVPGGQLKFYPPGGGEPILGALNPDGTYLVTDVPRGTVTVTVDTDSVAGRGGSNDYTKMAQGRGGFNPPEGGGGATGFVKIPAKYKDPKQSGLSAEVKKGKNENVNFDLKD